MVSNSKKIIMEQAKTIFAVGGYEALSMRELAKQSNLNLSSIYHFFADKDVLLKEVFDATGTELGVKRAQLKNRSTAYKTLEDRVRFQFDNIEDVLFVLKYYLHFRSKFIKQSEGYLPPEAYLHVDEVVKKGIETGEYYITDPVSDAKVVAHAINGFLIEYYPQPPKGAALKKLVSTITDFLHQSMSNERRLYVENK